MSRGLSRGRGGAPPRSPSPTVRRAVVTSLTVLTASAGCLDRPVVPVSPRTNNVLLDQVSQRSVDKIDLLFMIDNSGSMADKQQVLAKAIPDLVGRLVSPPCGATDEQGRFVAASAQPDPSGGADAACPSGQAREFTRITDIHIGVVSSSLGGHGSDSCKTTGNASGNNPTTDDHAHLLIRPPRADASVYVFDGAPVPTWNDEGFLAWDPSGRKNTPPGESDVAALTAHFTEVVLGADQVGCGYEAQLESWYRFLIEPNPQLTLEHADNDYLTAVTPSGTDTALLAQRADFLRPDSLVAILSLSDENDGSVIDGVLPAAVCRHPAIDAATGLASGCLAADGSACAPGDDTCGREPWPDAYQTQRNFQNGAPFPRNWLIPQYNSAPPHAPYPATDYFHLHAGTAACASDWASPDCHSCYQGDGLSPEPECQGAPLTAADDGVTLRLWDTRRRFGVDALYPLQRYVDGLKSAQVFDRNGYLVDNPLFSDLPYEKQVRAGGATRPRAPVRPSNQVFFASIAGVPWQDLARDPTDLSKGYKPAVGKPGDPGLDAPIDGLTLADGTPATAWDVILGDPFGVDAVDPITGQRGRRPLDPLMIESNHPRFGLGQAPLRHPITQEMLGDGWNSLNGSEWTTQFAVAGAPGSPPTPGPAGADLEYACIFPFAAAAPPRDCTQVKATGAACDCAEVYAGSHNPLCALPASATDKGTGMVGTFDSGQKQYRAKAYPGTRYLHVLRGIDEQAIVASICARNLDDESAPDFGYRPAVAAIIDRLKERLGDKCLPRKLEPDPDTGTTPCLILDAKMKKPAPGEPDPFSAADVAACNRCDGPAREPLTTSTHPVEPGTLTGDVTDYRCVCAVKQYGQHNGTTADELAACRSAPDPLSLSDGGWCYVDPASAGTKALADAQEKLVARCPSTEKQKIRFVNADTDQANLFITCLGAAAGAVEP